MGNMKIQESKVEGKSYKKIYLKKLEKILLLFKVNWENTTAALARGQAGQLMVKELDPDAPHR